MANQNPPPRYAGCFLGRDETPAMLLLAQSSTTTTSPDQALAALAAMSGIFLIIGLISIALTVLIYYFIFKRTGMNPWLSLLMLVPIANLVMLLILAFSEWPIEREVKMLRAQLGGYGGGTGYTGGAVPSSTITPT
jgi:uncharacterized membrane protein